MSIRDGIDVFGDRVRSAVDGMAPRERLLVAIAVLAVFGVAAFFVQGAMEESSKRLKRQITATSTAQGQVDQLMSQYRDLVGTVDALDTRLAAGADFQPLTWIESVGNEMGISEKIRSVNERGTETTDYFIAKKIDIRIDDVDLRQVTDLIYRLESAPQAVRIDECRVKTDRNNRSNLDVTMQIAVLQPAGGA